MFLVEHHDFHFAHRHPLHRTSNVVKMYLEEFWADVSVYIYLVRRGRSQCLQRMRVRAPLDDSPSLSWCDGMTWSCNCCRTVGSGTVSPHHCSSPSPRSVSSTSSTLPAYSSGPRVFERSMHVRRSGIGKFSLRSKLCRHLTKFLLPTSSKCGYQGHAVSQFNITSRRAIHCACESSRRGVL